MHALGEWNLGKRLRRLRNRNGFSIYYIQARTNLDFRARRGRSKRDRDKL